jgi:hypothetical protein
MSEVITSEAKKAYMLLNSIIFHYHGLDEEEELILRRIADEANAGQELQWAFDFISKDYLTAYERARVFLKSAMLKLDKSKRLDFINNTWNANFEKGYITEMEATAMLKLARDWEVDEDLIQIVQNV